MISLDLRAQTRTSLELDTVLSYFAQAAQTSEGKRRVLAMELLSLDDQKWHYERLYRWMRLLEQRKPLRLPDILPKAAFVRVATKNPFEALALRQLRNLLVFWRQLHQDEDLRFLVQEVAWHRALGDLTQRLEQAFDDEGNWSPDVSPIFGRLIREFDHTEGQIDRILSDVIRRSGSALNETMVYERNGRKVLAVNQDFRGKVRGMLQDYSSSGRTVFIEPEETIGLQNKLTQLVMEIEEELWKVRVDLTEAVLALPEIGAQICPALAGFDLFQALAKTAKACKCVAVKPNLDQQLRIFDGRHPFLDEAFAPQRQLHQEAEEKDGNRMIPFSLSLEYELRGLIISGANTGGKTVTLKTTGLLTWLANAGLPIPAEEASAIPFYAEVLADIGDHQSLSYNLSTYASHLATLNQMLLAPKGKTLVLLDELGSGTDPMEGNALSQAMIQAMLKREYHLLVTTHQQILCTFALNHEHLENASMSFDPKHLKPTYRFQQGVPGRSHALDIARVAGIPEAVLQEARQLIDDDQVDIQAAIRTLQQQAKHMSKQKQKLRRDELRLHRRIQDARKESEAMKRERETFREKERARLQKTIDRAERELRNLLANETKQKEARKALGRFSQKRQELMEPVGVEKLPTIEVEGSGQDAKEWKQGDRVYIKTFNTEGVLLDVERKRVRVDVKGKVMTLNLSDVLHLKPAADQPQKQVIQDSLEADSEAMTFEHNFLGYRVEDALVELDVIIDRALRRHMPLLRIIHGHGTGVLKAGVRDFLKRHHAKKQFEMVIDKENDGVTELKF
jgi:DNA mismatch repair protein MutS2